MNIKAVRLSETNFKEYGWTMRKPERGADAENEQLSYWDNSIVLSNFTGNGVLGFLEVKKVPIELKMLDLLTESIRIYLSLDAKPSVQFVALNEPGTYRPVLETLKAFILEGGEGVAIDKGVWHWTPYALTEKASFAMGLRGDIMSAEGGKYTVDDTKVKYSSLETLVKLSL